MATRSVATHSSRGLRRIERCSLRQIVAPAFHVSNRDALTRQLKLHDNVINRSQAYATAPRMRFDGSRARQDVDERARLGFYTVTKRQGILFIEPSTANAIYNEFLVQRGKISHGENVKRLATKYKVSLEDISSLALITHRVPDISDPVKRSQLPLSQHKPNAVLLLEGCAEAEDPLAVIVLMTAEYTKQMTGDKTASQFASNMRQKDVDMYRKILHKLSTRSKEFTLGPEALTLEGLFAEKEKREDAAKTWYLEAIERSHLKFNPKSRHPFQQPLIGPWNALGYLMKNSKHAETQQEARKYFHIGAFEADDPVSYYELASFEDRTSETWLQCISKAAASGHRQAIVDLADYYQALETTDLQSTLTTKTRQSLNWLLGWKEGSAGRLAREWLAAAAEYGHKPSSLKLADYHASIGDHEGAEVYMHQLVEPPSLANQSEEWPQLVQIGKKRLQQIAGKTRAAKLS